MSPPPSSVIHAVARKQGPCAETPKRYPIVTIRRHYPARWKERGEMEPVKIGVVGLGDFGRQHALTLAGIQEARLVALVALRQESLDALSGSLPGVPGW